MTYDYHYYYYYYYYYHWTTFPPLGILTVVLFQSSIVYSTSKFKYNVKKKTKKQGEIGST